MLLLLLLLLLPLLLLPLLLLVGLHGYDVLQARSGTRHLRQARSHRRSLNCCCCCCCLLLLLLPGFCFNCVVLISVAGGCHVTRMKGNAVHSPPRLRREQELVLLPSMRLQCKDAGGVMAGCRLLRRTR